MIIRNPVEIILRPEEVKLLKEVINFAEDNMYATTPAEIDKLLQNLIESAQTLLEMHENTDN